MIFILIFLSILVFGGLVSFYGWAHQKDGYLWPFLTSVILSLVLFIGFYSICCELEDDYIDHKLYNNPTVTQTLETIPFNNNPSNDIYISREENSFGNWVYTYCVKTDNGYEEKHCKKSAFNDIYVNHTNKNEQPYLEYNSKTQKSVLIKKPSYWFNIFGWFKFKDVSIGEVYEIVDENYIGAHTFYVPEGSLREIY